MHRAPWVPDAADTAEAIFRATEEQLIGHVAPAVGSEAVLAAGAFWPGGPTAETMEHGTVGGHRAGTLLGPSLGATIAMVEAFSGREGMVDDCEMATPLVVAVTATDVLVVDPGDRDTSPSVFKTFVRESLQVRVKHRGLARIVLLDDVANDVHFRLYCSPVRGARRTGPQRSVLAALTDAA